MAHVWLLPVVTLVQITLLLVRTDPLPADAETGVAVLVAVTLAVGMVAASASGMVPPPRIAITAAMTETIVRKVSRIPRRVRPRRRRVTARPANPRLVPCCLAWPAGTSLGAIVPGHARDPVTEAGVILVIGLVLRARVGWASREAWWSAISVIGSDVVWATVPNWRCRSYIRCHYCSRTIRPT